MGLVVSQVGRPYFENARPGAGSILQVMSVAIAWEKGSAISDPQDLLTAFRDEHNLSLQNVHELLCLGVPMALAGPGARLQFKKVDADLLEPGRYRQPMSYFVLARRGEWFRIARASRDRRALDIYLLHS